MGTTEGCQQPGNTVGRRQPKTVQCSHRRRRVAVALNPATAPLPGITWFASAPRWGSTTGIGSADASRIDAVCGHGGHDGAIQRRLQREVQIECLDAAERTPEHRRQIYAQQRERCRGYGCVWRNACFGFSAKDAAGVLENDGASSDAVWRAQCPPDGITAVDCARSRDERG